MQNVSHFCPSCRIRRARPHQAMMTNLPPARLGYQAPVFHRVGVDYFGPIFVQCGRRTEKRYGALFTCMTTRVIHIEISHSLETDAYIMAMKRMMARRGKPAHVWSVNGTNFVGAEKEIREAIDRWNNEHIKDRLSQDAVQWHFNPPASPHFGGVWELLVRSSKTALKTIAGKQRVNDEIPLTFMAETESLLNSRPRPSVNSDPPDLEALTPNHFLLGCSNPALPLDIVTDKDLSSRKIWRHAQVMIQHFWKRWLCEYLPKLTERRKWNRSTRNVSEGDLALVVD